MIDLKTKEKLKFKSANELKEFMNKQNENDFLEYAKQYSVKNRGWMIIKDENKYPKIIKVHFEELTNIDNIEAVKIDSEFVYYKCLLYGFDGVKRTKIVNNELFIDGILGIDLGMWDRLK